MAFKQLTLACTLFLSILILLPTPTAPQLREHSSESIAQTINNEHISGNEYPRLTLHARILPSAPTAGETGSAAVGIISAIGEGEELEVIVREPIQAVLSTTLISEYDGPERLVGDLPSTVLVADEEEEGGSIALVAVSKASGDVNGIVQKKGDARRWKIKQQFGEKAWAFPAPEFIPPKWECNVDKIDKPNIGGDDRPNLDRPNFNDGKDANHRRRLTDDGQQNHSSHHHGNNAHHDFDGQNIEQTLSHIKEKLHGSNIRLGERRRVQENDERGYSYTVDITFDVDRYLVDQNGGIFDPNTVEYINAIVTGANSIYEPEIDTHLNVRAIQLVDYYDGYDDLVDVIDEVQNRHGGNNWPGGDLYHASLGNPQLLGGIAYVGVVCNTRFGFGVEGIMQGNFESMDYTAVWDMLVVTHEIGHNFNTGHTFSIEDYNPLVDECIPGRNGMSCPDELPSEKSATIMGYCHLCPGNFENVAYTFGGTYTGSGDRGDIDNYINLESDVSYEPRRVNVVMWDHISTRGSCVNNPVDPTPPPSEPPVMPPTPYPIDVPEGGTPEPTPSPTGFSGGGCAGINIAVEVHTDNNPHETSWTLVNTMTEQTVEMSPVYSKPVTSYLNQYCVEKAEYTFTIYDTGNDGLCCEHGNGSYEVKYGSEVVASGAEFTSSESATFGQTNERNASKSSKKLGGKGSKKAKSASPTLAPAGGAEPLGKSSKKSKGKSAKKASSITAISATMSFSLSMAPSLSKGPPFERKRTREHKSTVMPIISSESDKARV